MVVKSFVVLVSEECKPLITQVQTLSKIDCKIANIFLSFCIKMLFLSLVSFNSLASLENMNNVIGEDAIHLTVPESH